MTARWITADVFDGLATLETGSVDLVVTSPPFLALRSYLPADHPDKHKEIGSEATPAEFIDVLLRVTAELRRVLAPHGSICVELGDTYAGSGGAGGDYNDEGLRDGQEKFSGSARRSRLGWPLPKSLCMIPESYRWALVYGRNPFTGLASPAGMWRARNDVTWARPNPPVGALGDKWRPATSDLIVACTSGKRYWDDLATRKPPGNGQRNSEKSWDNAAAAKWGDRSATGFRGWHDEPVTTERTLSHASGAPLLDYWEIPLLEGEEPKQYGPGEKSNTHRRNAKGVDQRPNTTPSGQRDGNWSTLPITDENNPHGAPLLDYWEIPPGGYKGSHYAVFPEELVAPCVKAMCPEKVCRVCGEPSRRIVEQTEEYAAFRERKNNGERQATGWTDNVGNRDQSWDHHDDSGARGELHKTTGWTDCGHDDYRPGLILDPFAGSGTTLAVATGHGHDAIGIDLDPRNADLARDRIGPFLFEETRML